MPPEHFHYNFDVDGEPEAVVAIKNILSIPNMRYG
ncbi:hypothetical protein DFO57_10810 [Pantoea sp. AG702]|jgi:hypothetical protein|nr:hypothetical protein DFO57_10810 [Pantoea sp. AG702]